MRLIKLILPFLILAIAFGAKAQVVSQMGFRDYSVYGQMNIGSGRLKSTSPSAFLEIGDSLFSRKGVLFPAGNKDSVSNPVRRLLFYDLPTNRYVYYNGTGWVDFGSGGNTYLFNNGISNNSGNVSLGGQLSSNATIDANNKFFTVANSGNVALSAGRFDLGQYSSLSLTTTNSVFGSLYPGFAYKAISLNQNNIEIDVGGGNALKFTNLPRSAKLWGLYYDSTTKEVTFAPITSGAGGGSGTVIAGTQFRISYYPSNGAAVAEAPAITSGRVLISNVNGLPTHSPVTDTELGFVAGVTGSIQSQLNTKLSAETDPSAAKKTNNLSDLSSPASARTNLGLGVAAIKGVRNDLTQNTPGVEVLDAAAVKPIVDSLAKHRQELNITSTLKNASANNAPDTIMRVIDSLNAVIKHPKAGANTTVSSNDSNFSFNAPYYIAGANVTRSGTGTFADPFVWSASGGGTGGGYAGDSILNDLKFKAGYGPVIWDSVANKWWRIRAVNSALNFQDVTSLYASGGDVAITFTSLQHVLQGPAGTWKPDPSTATSGSNGNTGISNLILPAGVTGRIYCERNADYPGGANLAVLGLSQSATLPTLWTSVTGVGCDVQNGDGQIITTENASPAAVSGEFVTTTYKFLGILRNGSTGVLKLQKSSDTVTWVDVFTYGQTYTGNMYGFMDAYYDASGGGKILNPKVQTF